MSSRTDEARKRADPLWPSLWDIHRLSSSDYSAHCAASHLDLGVQDLDEGRAKRSDVGRPLTIRFQP